MTDKKKRLLSLEDVSFCYDSATILENVNVTLYEGDFVGIFGPNGGGKTTFLQILAGLLEPSKGLVLRNHRSKIGYVPQFSKLDKQFPISVFDLVLMGSLSELTFFGRYSKNTKQKAMDALEKVGLLEKKDLPFGVLSGGQAQRALIARAIVSNPEILLLDEPTASVDLPSQEDIFDLLDNFHKDNVAIVMVSHDLQTVLKKSEKLLCIHRKVSSWKPDEICSHFALGLYHQPLEV